MFHGVLCLYVCAVAPHVTAAPREQTLSEGDRGIVVCLVTDGIREVEWKRNGVSVARSNSSSSSSSNGRYTILPSGSLRISAVSQQDTGTYTCTVSNRAGSDSKEISVNVYQEVRKTNSTKTPTIG